MTPSTPFIAHLIELRARLLRFVLCWLLVFGVLYPFAGEIYTGFARPLLRALPAGGQMIATAVLTPFFVPIKLAMLLALVLVLPYALYQLWAFVAPGLYGHEKKLVVSLMLASSVLFLLGMLFAYQVILPIMFGFILKAAPLGVAVMTDIGEYLDFVMTLLLVSGLAFEVPILVVCAVRFGWVSLAKLRAGRAYAIITAFVLGAILTPPDVLSQLLLAIPMCLLYELGLFIARYISPKPPPTILDEHQ